MIPRHPVNLYFNVVTPDEWLAEDQCLHPAGTYGHVNSYAELLDRESSVLLGYLLTGDIDPLMFHQPNLVAYDQSGHFLLSDLLDRTLARYNALLRLPVVSLAMNAIGKKMSDRMSYDSSGVSATIVPGQSIAIKAVRAATIPVTGLKTSSSESYGGQNISYVKLQAGQTVTLPLN